MTKRILCLLLCLLLLPAHGLASSVEDSIIIGMISTRSMELRPLVPVEKDIISLYSIVYESLVTIDDNGLPQPLLAESWDESGGGKIWTFTLRENVTFSDGTPLTAQDVVASCQYILDLANNQEVTNHGFYANIRYMVSSITARDERTVEVKAARDYYGLLYAMTFPVVPASQVEMANPYGTGPYIITAFEPLSYMMLSANPLWWQTQPQVQEITITFYQSNKDMITAYEYGHVDAACTRSVAAAQYRSGINSLSLAYTTRQLETLMLNNRSFPLDSLNVRKAIRYAINVDLIDQSVFMGMTTDANTPIPSDSWLYYDQERTFVYNPDKARQLLEEDGWGDSNSNGILDKVVDGKLKNLRLALHVYEDPENDVRFETANLIADMLHAVGIDAHVETASYDECKTKLEAGSFDLLLCAFHMDVVPDPGFFLRSGNTQNYARYKSSAMDELITTLRTQEVQADFYYTSQAIQQRFAEDVPFICLFYRSGAILTRKMFTTVRSIREYELLRGIEAFGR